MWHFYLKYNLVPLRSLSDSSLTTPRLSVISHLMSCIVIDVVLAASNGPTDLIQEQVRLYVFLTQEINEKLLKKKKIINKSHKYS